MNVVDLHPEELLDKEARGELGESERARLEAHVAQCAACRIERQLRLDFADERAGDDAGADAYTSERIALALAHRQAPKPAEPETAQRPASRPPRRGRVARAWMLAAAAIVAVAGVAAAQEGGRAFLRRVVGLEPTAFETAPSPPAAPVAPIAKPTSLETPPPPPPEPAAPEIAPAPAPSSAPSLAARPAPSAIARAPRSDDAATLFDAANEARRRGDYARAIELHRELEDRHPTTREAQVSRATLGRLLLDRGDLVGALASFDDYRAHGHGELDEEVLVGRATALERLGRTTEARRAWQDLLAAFPSSPYAEHARAKIASEVDRP